MNIKANVVNEPKHVVLPYSNEHKLFIAKRIKQQGNKRFTNFKSVVIQSICVLAVLALCISILGITLHIASYYQAKKDIETQALIQQLENGEVVEMTARVGGQHE
ncbi:hypothetical protein [Acinetobacter venetianus]|uniref:Uncharacterized protein n=1 Tax=Acinetobacter venetianus TaxID=52133 RepID=A0A150HU73_9GAMM|nr:hypothetical protein [Acinetobacter venetianus]KXZ70366.1 hypothetical protein AVENLUH13518_01850 [Acinetobacter venetianus]